MKKRDAWFLLLAGLFFGIIGWLAVFYGKNSVRAWQWAIAGTSFFVIGIMGLTENSKTR